MDKSFDQSRQPEKNINRKSQIDPEGKKSFNQSLRFTQSAAKSNRERQIQQNQSVDKSVDEDFNPVQWKIDQNLNQAQMGLHAHLKRGNQGQRSAEQDKLEESGYDGGKSSFLITSGIVSDEDDSSSEEVDADESSTEEGNVLGLLYYDGASSAGESEARESRRSRRSGRTGQSRQSSGKTSRNSSRKSSKLKSSRSQKSRRKMTKPVRKIAEESEYQQQQLRVPQIFHGNATGEYQQPHTYVTDPTRKDNLSGSIIFANSNVTTRRDDIIPEEYDNANPGGAQSFYSHGSTIRTEDSHCKAYAHNDGPRQDDHNINSVGECTTDLNNNPEVKI